MAEPDPADTLELTDEQRRRAEDALARVESGEVTSGDALVETWRPGPEWRDMRTLCPAGTDPLDDAPGESERWVSVENIAGISRELHGRFMPNRLTGMLRLLLDGKFRPAYPRSKPHYVELDGDLFVMADGTHRSLACKVAGVEEIHARVEPVPVDPDRYRDWMGDR